MLKRANLGYIRDPRLSIVKRAAEWCAASELDTSREDAAHVVDFLRVSPDHSPEANIFAREINKYLDRVATVLEVKDGALREENRTIVTLRAENQELRKQLLEQPHPTMEAFEKQNDTIQELRDALNKEQAKLATLQGTFTALEADRDAQEACALRLRGELATADRERMELRACVRKQASGNAQIQTQLNVANDMTQTLQNANTILRCDLRDLQEQKTMSEANEHAVREVEEKKANVVPVTVNIEALNDLKREYAKLAADCNDIKAERDALLAKNRERADRSGEEYAKSVDFTGLGEAAKRLRMHTHAGPSPDFLEDTQLPAPSSDLDPEVLVISEVLPCISDLAFHARRRVLRYLTDRLVNDRVVNDAL
jgi:chromosome segregation ATPase